MWDIFWICQVVIPQVLRLVLRQRSWYVCIYIIIYIYTRIYQVHNHISENKYTNRQVNHYVRMCRMPRNMYIITYNDQRTQQQLYMNSMFWGLTHMMYFFAFSCCICEKGHRICLTPLSRHPISSCGWCCPECGTWSPIDQKSLVMCHDFLKKHDTGLTGIMVFLRGIIPKWPQDSG